MPTELLLKSLRDEVFQHVVGAGFGPVDFEWKEWHSEADERVTISALAHRPSEDYWFLFDWNNRGNPCTTFSPGRVTRKEARNSGSWELQIQYFDDWLSYLRREIEAPDLWSKLTAGPGVNAGTSNSRFTSAELTSIVDRLTQIEARITEVKSLQQGEAQYVHESLDYLRTAAKTEGRRNWLYMAVGVIFNVVVFLGLPPNLAGSLFRFGVEHLQGLGLAIAGAIPPDPAPLPGPPPLRR